MDGEQQANVFEIILIRIDSEINWKHDLIVTYFRDCSI